MADQPNNTSNDREYDVISELSLQEQVRAHHIAIGNLFDSEFINDNDIESLHKHNRKYRAIMYGIRLFSMAQAYHFYS